MPRPHSLLGAAIGAVVAVGCGGGDAPPAQLASPSAACEESFVAAGAAGERPDVESPRSPDIEALRATLDACPSADEWLTAARGNPSALPLELDRETALDQLCAGHEGSPVCVDWESSGAG